MIASTVLSMIHILAECIESLKISGQLNCREAGKNISDFLGKVLGSDITKHLMPKNTRPYLWLDGDMLGPSFSNFGHCKQLAYHRTKLDVSFLHLMMALNLPCSAAQHLPISIDQKLCACYTSFTRHFERRSIVDELSDQRATLERLFETFSFQKRCFFHLFP